MRPLVLASASAYRRELLTRLGVRFDVVAPAVSEEDLAGEGEVRAGGAHPRAGAKARTVAQQYPEAIVVGSDQVAAMGARVLHKSGHAAGAREQLTTLSGKAANFFTACAIIGTRANVHEVHLDTTHVVFRVLSAEEIARYVEREQPFDCAGSFKIESLGVALLERIDMSDPTALIGLPLIWTALALRRLGYAVP